MTGLPSASSDHHLDAKPLIQGQQLEIRPGRHVSLAYRAPDTIGGPVVFFIHGGGGNKDQWRYQWEALAEQGYGLVAWDLLGHGQSDKPRNPAAYAWDELVADVLAVLSRFKGTDNTLVAHSFGTALGLDALTRLASTEQRQTVRRALLLGTQLKPPSSAGRLLRLPAWLLERLRPLLSRSFRERAWHPSAAPDLVAYEESLTRQNRMYVFKALLTQARWIRQAELKHLTLPIRILAGDRDGLTPAEGAAELAAALPDAQVQELVGCGHQLMLEQPMIVNFYLQRLLAGRPHPVADI